MKKIIFIMLSCLFIIFSTKIAFSEEEHYCPPEGVWEKNTIYLIYPGTDCIIKIEWCCYLDEDGNSHYSEIHISEADNNNVKHCMASIDANQLFFWAYLEIIKRPYVCVPILPPCDDPQQPPYLIFDVTNAKCYRYENVRRGVLGDYIYVLKFVPCNSSAQCVTVYEECWDYAKEERKVIKINQYIKPGLGCASLPPLLPPLGKDWEEEWTTQCFFIGCP